MIEYRLAGLPDVAAVRAFFARNLEKGNPAVYSEEFFCPLGVKAAIQRRQMFLALDGKSIAGAVRFYPKKNGEFSLYQFAIDPGFRGQGLARAMLDAVRQGRPMHSQCPSAAAFNRYYERSGWRLEGIRGAFNQWVLD